jgi:hypothetical protein
MQQLEAESWQTQDWENDEGDDDNLKFYLNTLDDDNEIRARANIQPTDVKQLITSFINDDDLFQRYGI